MEPRLVLAIGGVVVACIAVGSFAAAATTGDEGPSAGDAAPMADAGLDQTVTVDTAVQLDGTGSTHPDGSITGYEWSIRPPTGQEIQPDCPSCERTQFTPTVPGRYEVTLEVSDGAGTRSTDTLYVFVGDAGPTVEVDGDRTPDPAEPVEFTATAESSGAELEEIAWSVDDEIVDIRPLDGHDDVSTLHFSFTETETHRVQVVVKTETGRTDYDDIYVQPQAEDDPSPSIWSSPSVSTPEPSCSDGVYFSENTQECLNVTRESTPEPTPEPSEETTPEEVEKEYIEYVTDGFYQDQPPGILSKDSSYIGQQIESLGVDGGENAPWRESFSEQVYDSTVGSASTFLFGQEEETTTCEITTGEFDSCRMTTNELEKDGRTKNVHSPDESGLYSKYGLEGAERVEGDSPEDLIDSQKAEVTIVTQPEKEGAVDKTIRTAKGVKGELQSAVDSAIGEVNSDQTEIDTENSGTSSSVLGSRDSTSRSGGRHDSSSSADNVQKANPVKSSTVDVVSGHDSGSNLIGSPSSGTSSESKESDTDGTRSGSTVGLVA